MLTLSRELHSAIRAEAVLHHPNECCGMVAQDPANAARWEVFRMRNADPNPRFAYAFSPGDQRRAFERMDTEGLEPWIIYHSHTETDAEPSGTDKASAWFDGVHYVIVTTAFGVPELKSFFCQAGELVEEEVVVT